VQDAEMREMRPSLSQTEDLVRSVRLRLEDGFSPDTASGHGGASVPSAGHCAVVALILHATLGADLVSARYEGTSHWFNRVRTGHVALDVDLTGDQFGFPSVRVGAPGSLFPGTRVRQVSEVSGETISRAVRLAQRSRLPEAAQILAGYPHGPRPDLR
jgi:hypothetical protein